MTGGSEVGTGHVSVFPVMTGFRNRVAKEMQASGKSGASMFSKAFNGAKAGRDAGREMRKTFEQATQGLGGAGFKRLASAASDAGRQMSTARQQQRAAAAQAEIAERKLAEAIGKYGEGSSQALAAQERLTQAQEKSLSSSDRLTQAQEKLAQARKAVFDVAADSGDNGLAWLKTETENATRAVETSRTRLAQANQSVEKSEENLRQAIAKSGADSEAAAKAQARLASSKARAGTASDQLAAAEQRLSSAQEETRKATERAGQSLKESESDAGAFKRAMAGARETLAGLKGGADDARNGLEGLKGTLATIGVGTAFAAAFKSGIEQADLQGTMKAALGDTTAADEAAKVASGIYMDGWGESLDQVNEAVIQTKNTLRDIDPAGLDKVTRSALVMSDTFGADVSESVRGVNVLMERFGLSANEASDLMVAGMQRGLNYTDELGDNLAEYSGRWADAGMSASQYFSLLQAGTDNGAYNLDKVGDFLNEFLTSLSNGRLDEGIGNFSEGTQNVFDNFKNGKATAQDVLNAVIGEMDKMTDSTKRASIASELWSSLGEDNAWSMIGALADVKDSYGDVAGAADKAAGNAQSMGQKWQAFVRTLTGSVSNGLMPVIEQATSFVERNGDKISRTIEGVSQVAGNLVSAFLDLPTPVQAGMTAIALFGGKLKPIFSLASSAASGIGAVVKAVAGLAGGRSNAASNLGAIAKGMEHAGESAGTAAGKTSGLSGVLGGFGPAGLALSAALGIAATGIIGYQEQVEKAKNLSNELKTAMQTSADAVKQFWKGIEQGTDENADFSVFEKLFQGVNADNIKELADQYGVSMKTIQDAVAGSSKALDEIQAKVKNSPPGNAFKGKISELGNEYKTAISEMIAASQDLKSIDSVWSGVSASVSDVGTSLKANGDATRDFASMTGASKSALEGFSASVLQNAASVVANASAYGGMDQALQTAKNRVQEMRDALVSQLTALGQTPEQAAAVADSLGLIPSDITTHMTFDGENAKAEIQAYVDTLSLTPEQKTTFMNALTDAANGNVAGLKLNMDTLPDVVNTFLNADPSNANAQTKAVEDELVKLGLMQPTAKLKADKSDADAKTDDAKRKVDAFGATKATAGLAADNSQAVSGIGAAQGLADKYGLTNASARLGADNGQAISQTTAAQVTVDKFGNCHVKATVGVTDNASGPINSILGGLRSIASNAWNAVVNVFKGGDGKAAGGLIRRATGGIVGESRFAALSAYGPSGLVSGPGSATSDSIPTWLSNGEYVIRAASVRKIGVRTLDRLNRDGTVGTTVVNGGLSEETLTSALVSALATLPVVEVKTPQGMAMALAGPLDDEIARRGSRGVR